MLFEKHLCHIRVPIDIVQVLSFCFVLAMFLVAFEHAPLITQNFSTCIHMVQMEGFLESFVVIKPSWILPNLKVIIILSCVVWSSPVSHLLVLLHLLIIRLTLRLQIIIHLLFFFFKRMLMFIIIAWETDHFILLVLWVIIDKVDHGAVAGSGWRECWGTVTPTIVMAIVVRRVQQLTVIFTVLFLLWLKCYSFLLAKIHHDLWGFTFLLINIVLEQFIRRLRRHSKEAFFIHGLV